MQPAVVLLSHGVEHVGLRNPHQALQCRVQDGDVDAVGVHVFQPGVGLGRTRPVHQLGVRSLHRGRIFHRRRGIADDSGHERVEDLLTQLQLLEHVPVGIDHPHAVATAHTFPP